ncbi:MAG: hypothetical protein V2A58_10870 [Planctomycetota bacterium]
MRRLRQGYGGQAPGGGAGGKGKREGGQADILMGAGEMWKLFPGSRIVRQRIALLTVAVAAVGGV